MRFFYHFGSYILLLKSLFVRPEKPKLYWKETMRQMVAIGLTSLGIVSIISLFLGAVTTVQSAFQLTSALIPKSVIGSVVSDSTILELAPTVTCLVLAGKVGSSIASELGTMRISEQIDALEIMGVNTSSYLIAPKILAAVITIPMLIIIACVLSIWGGMMAGSMTGIVPANQFIQGAQDTFSPFAVVISMTKAFTFAFIISSVSAYQGFYTEGGALEVGKASTRSVVYCCILILVFDYFIAELFL